MPDSKTKQEQSEILKRVLSVIPSHHGGDKEFAISIGYKSGNVIADWKAGRNSSFLRKLPIIAEVSGVSLDWLCGNEDEIKKAPAEIDGEDEKEILEIFKRLTPAKQALLMEKAKEIADI